MQTTSLKDLYLHACLLRYVSTFEEKFQSRNLARLLVSISSCFSNLKYSFSLKNHNNFFELQVLATCPPTGWTCSTCSLFQDMAPLCAIEIAQKYEIMLLSYDASLIILVYTLPHRPKVLLLWYTVTVHLLPFSCISDIVFPNLTDSLALRTLNDLLRNVIDHPQVGKTYSRDCWLGNSSKNSFCRFNVAGIERERLWVFMFRESDNIADIAARSDRKESKYQRIKAEKFRTWDRLS